MLRTAHERVQLARHPDRPYSMDLFNSIFEDFVEIHGDRRFADDTAIVCGFAKLNGIEVCVIGQQKGRDMKSRQHRNFAMSKPEGYRKALRVMQLAEKFSRPIITIIDTPGAYPGIDAEERGQAEAIAYNLKEMASLKVSVICLVLGEGGSGGALAIGIGNAVLMMENAVYSVITPEGCAAILWKDASQAPRASEGLKLTANELIKFGIIDEVVPEFDEWKAPFEENDKTSENLKKILLKYLKDLGSKSELQLIGQRFQKFRKMGEWIS